MMTDEASGRRADALDDCAFLSWHLETTSKRILDVGLLVVRDACSPATITRPLSHATSAELGVAQP